jgi:hypothetical protein
MQKGFFSMRKVSVSWICSGRNPWRVGLLWTLIAWTIFPVWAGDWPNWRGPSYDGASEETHLPERFSPTENVFWSQPMPGPDAATPIVIGNRIYVSATEKSGTGTLLSALCLERETGQTLWKKQVPRLTENADAEHLGVPSPVSDGKRSYFLMNGRSGGAR